MATADRETIETATVSRRLRRTRGVLGFAVLAACGVVLLGLAARDAWRLSRAPDMGLDVGTDARVSAADGRWLSARPGDRVVEVDGTAVAGQTDWMRAQRRVDSDLVLVRFVRGDTSFLEVVNTDSLSGPSRFALWVRVLTGGLLLLLGLGAFVLRPGVRETWLLLLAAWGLGAWMLGETVPALLVPSLAFIMPLAGACTLHFMIGFPRPVSAFARRPRLTASIYVVPVALIAAQILSRAVTGSWDDVNSWWADLHVARYGWLALCGALGIAAMVAQYRNSLRSADATDAARARGLVVGIALGLTVPLIWSVARHLLGVGGARFAAYYNSAPMLIFVGMSAYVAVRHNALAIDRFTGAIAGWAVTVFLAAVAFAGLLLGLPLLLGGGDADLSPAIMVGLTAAVFAASAPVYRRVRRRIDRRFFREYDASDRMQRALSKLLIAVRGSNAGEGVREALGVLRSLPSDRAELWQLDDSGAAFLRGTVAGHPPSDEAPARVPRESELGKAVGEQRLDGGVEGLAPRQLPRAAQAELAALGLVMIAPVIAHGGPIGFVGVERKPSGAAFKPEDLTFLSIVAGQIGLALEHQGGDERALGRYRIERRLGVGGMAEVFLAWQLGPGGFERKVALKRPLPGLAQEPTGIELFLDEARISAELRHPCIARIYEVGEASGSYFLAMEYVDGISMRDVLARAAESDERVPLAIAVRAVSDVLGALEHAHAATDSKGRPLRVVHRDIKPGNIILSREGEIKLVDFGIARAATQMHTTKAGTVRGTLAYMSPEQAAGGDVDLRTDLYSTGAVLYELATGRRAFPGGPMDAEWSRPEPDAGAGTAERPVAADATVSTRDGIVVDANGKSLPPQPISANAPDVPPEIDDVFYRAVAFDPDARYQSAADMLEQLVRAAENVTPASKRELAELASRMLAV